MNRSGIKIARREFEVALLPHQGRVHKILEQRLAASSARVGECLIWTGSTNKAGYGKVSFGKGCVGYAHRLAWLLAHSGLVINRSREVDHSCNNPACIEPRHLGLVTHARNMELGALRRRTLLELVL